MGVAVVMITLNEAHNLKAVLDNLGGWASEIFVVDSYSQDDTVDIALEYGVHIVQRKFDGFGDQWNFAIDNLPITSSWVMKLDPDERISEKLKKSINSSICGEDYDAFSVSRSLFLMGRRLPVKQNIIRIWRRGACRFSNALVNEHPIISGKIGCVKGELEHHDSPNLEHWIDKQNRYTSAKAWTATRNHDDEVVPRFFGNLPERRKWLRERFYSIPFRYFLLFIYNWLWLGAWRAGYVGYMWARLRSDIMRLAEYKKYEIEALGGSKLKLNYGPGSSDARVPQY